MWLLLLQFFHSFYESCWCQFWDKYAEFHILWSIWFADVD